jgi:hypothetical protein
MFHRSPSHGRFIKLMTFYARSCRLAAKAYDTFNSFGLLFSQNWVLKQVAVVAENSMVAMRKDIEHHPFFFTSDNINIAYSVQEQTLQNKDKFASGVATTLYVIKAPRFFKPDNTTFREKRALGRAKQLTWAEIVEFDKEHAEPVRDHTEYMILRILFDAPAFGYKNWDHRESHEIAEPERVKGLPYGPAHRTRQYVLPTREQEVASTEGNDKAIQWTLRFVLKEKLRTKQFREAIALDHVIFWMGDQLTDSRVQTLLSERADEHNSFSRYDFLLSQWAWLHQRMTYNESLHEQLYGDDRKGDFGLAYLFQRLGRKGLSSPTIKGTFFHSLELGLSHILHAQVRTLWLQAADATELAELRNKTPTELRVLAKKIHKDYISDTTIRNQAKLKDDKRDHLRHNQMVMTQELLNWAVLQRAVKRGDVGVMKGFLVPLLLRYKGGNHPNYAQAIYNTLQGFIHEWSEDVQ